MSGRSSPYDLAERCFALARSTTFDGERVNAIARGVAIAEKAGLPLDRFDIPGRPRPRRRPRPAGQPEQVYSYRPRNDDPPSGKAPRFYTADDISEAMARFRAATAAQEATINTASEAARRMRDAVDEFAAQAADRGSCAAAAFERGRAAAEMRKATERQPQMHRWPDIVACADFVFSRGVHVYDLGLDAEDCRWFAPGREAGEYLNDKQLRDLSDQITGV